MTKVDQILERSISGLQRHIRGTVTLAEAHDKFGATVVSANVDARPSTKLGRIARYARSNFIKLRR